MYVVAVGQYFAEDEDPLPRSKVIHAPTAEEMHDKAISAMVERRRRGWSLPAQVTRTCWFMLVLGMSQCRYNSILRLLEYLKLLPEVVQYAERVPSMRHINLVRSTLESTQLGRRV